jgi:hypothetical protein
MRNSTGEREQSWLDIGIESDAALTDASIP